MRKLLSVKTNEKGDALIGMAIIISLIMLVALMAIPDVGHWAAKTLCEIPTLSGGDREYNKNSASCCRPDDEECLGEGDPPPCSFCV